MSNIKQSSCFECAVWVSALSLALLLPTAALAGDDGGDEISAAIARTSEPLQVDVSDSDSVRAMYEEVWMRHSCDRYGLQTQT